MSERSQFSPTGLSIGFIISCLTPIAGYYIFRSNVYHPPGDPLLQLMIYFPICGLFILLAIVAAWLFLNRLVKVSKGTEGYKLGTTILFPVAIYALVIAIILIKPFDFDHMAFQVLMGKSNFRNITMENTNLSSLYLNGVDLSGANLENSNFFGADLGSADLSSADLSGANLGGAKLGSANLAGADLSGANLARANLSSADLMGADLGGADLRGEFGLYGSDLSGANLKGAVYDVSTKWPKGFNPEKSGAIKR